MNKIGSAALKDAFYHYVELIHSNAQFPDHVWKGGFFTYIPTKKQKSRILGLSNEHGWGLANQDIRGITITGSFLSHVIKARIEKDGASWRECAEILSLSFHATSEIANNVSKHHDRQGLMFNSKKRVTLAGKSQYAMSVFRVENEISPVTAYAGNRARFESKTGR